MIAIEHTNVEIFLGHMLAHVLNVDAEVGQAIYWKPQSATLRIGILEAAAEQMFRPRYKGSEEIAENRIDADNEAIWNKVRFIVARAKKLTFQRNDRIHTVWGTQGDSQEHVARAPAFTTSSDPSQIKTVPLNELNRIVADLRSLIDDARSTISFMEQTRLRQTKAAVVLTENSANKPLDQGGSD